MLPKHKMLPLCICMFFVFVFTFLILFTCFIVWLMLFKLSMFICCQTCSFYCVLCWFHLFSCFLFPVIFSLIFWEHAKRRNEKNNIYIYIYIYIYIWCGNTKWDFWSSETLCQLNTKCKFSHCPRAPEKKKENNMFSPGVCFGVFLAEIFSLIMFHMFHCCFLVVSLLLHSFSYLAFLFYVFFYISFTFVVVSFIFFIWKPLPIQTTDMTTT